MRCVFVLLVVFLILDISAGYGLRRRNRCGRGRRSCVSVSRCYAESQRCDGHVDCGDYSDEYTCPGFECPDGKFHCSDGPCITASWRCDGDEDCNDGSDERNCYEDSHGCGPGRSSCVSVLGCYANSQRCDGQIDCGDFSDEYNCTGFQCPSGKFHCNDGPCITASWQCDGEADCNDGSDELNCYESGGRCGPRRRSCVSVRGCYALSQRCDGQIDCGDYSDEYNCPGFQCPRGKFHCNDGPCITASWRCDGDTDCNDGSDEQNCPH